MINRFSEFNLISEEQSPFAKLFNWKGWLKKTPKVKPGQLGADDLKLVNSLLSKVESQLGDELIDLLRKNVKLVEGKPVMVTRAGNVLDLEKVTRIVQGVKSGKVDLDKFIKILPEKFSDGTLCASKFRQQLSGQVSKVPSLAVTKGIKFSPQDQSKVLKNLNKIKQYWNKSTWTEAERKQGFKEIEDELEIAVLPESVKSKRVSKEDHKKWIDETLDKELEMGTINQQEYDFIKKENEDWFNNWSKFKYQSLPMVQGVPIPNSVIYAKRTVRFKIWDKEIYLKHTGEKDVTGGQCYLIVNDGKTESIIDIFPDSYGKEFPGIERLKSLIYHEITHAKDASLFGSRGVGYRKNYVTSTSNRLEDIDGKKFYKSTQKVRGKKGKTKQVMKEYDYYKNYFVHEIENRAIFRESLETMKVNANEWLRKRIDQYKKLGWDDLESKKRGMQDTINWLRDSKQFLKSVDSLIAAGKIKSGESTWKDVPLDITTNINHFWQLVGNYRIGNVSYTWIKELRDRNPEAWKVYSKKLATQIDEWINKLSPQAFESFNGF